MVFPRKKRAILYFLLINFFLLTTNVNASTNLSTTDYNRLKNVFTEARISTMSDEEIAKYLSYDLENSITTQKIFKVTETTNGYTYSEVDEDEVNAALNDLGIQLYDDSHRETSYKMIRISATHISGNYYLMNLYAKWLINPVVKSFDVMGLRLDDASMVANSQSGIQLYNIGTATGNVNYSPNGTNIKKSTNGFGISMNLVDEGTNFECNIQADVIATTKYATVYGTYQHAAKNVTLAQSQNYVISHNGLGKVLNFDSSVVANYDRMGGVSVALDYTS